PRPVSTVLDSLRERIDAEQLDAIVLGLETVAADLGYGDIRPLPGSIAWIDKMRDGDKKAILFASGERGNAALALAGAPDRFDAVLAGPRAPETFQLALDQVSTEADRAALVDISPTGISAGRMVGFDLLIAVARGSASPEELRQSGAQIVVADLQELLGPT